MAIQGFFTGDVKIRDLNGVLKAVNGIVEVATDAGTVTSVGLTVGSSGTDVNVANSPITTSGSITLNLPTASATNRGLLSSADWTTFNSKQGTITLTTTGSSGAATLIGTTLNIPNYGSALTGYVPYTGATTNVNLGEFELKAGQLTLDVSPTGTAAVGTTRWNNTIGISETTLKGGSVILKNGVDLVARVVNKVTPNTTLTKANYPAVRVSGAQGQRLAVAYAQANNDSNSADTIGLVTETIATNQEGFIMTVGQLEGINTTGSLQGETWADGDVLYLSPTTPGALTNIKPTGATGHIVVMGYVEYAHANNGAIYVKVMNGWELDELHNVYISSVANNQGLFYESSTQLWKNKSIATVLGYTPANAATTLTINGTTYDISANRTWNVGTVTSIGTSGPLTGGTITGSGTIGITQATTSTDGYLSSTDWNTFNSKQAALTFSAPLVNTSGTISIPAASASVNGYLSSTDWVTFNNKQAALNGTGFVKISGTTISYDNSTYYLASNPSAFIALTALSATAPLSYSNTTGVFSISQSTTSTDGYLSSTDWNTFNNKQAAGSYITALTGEATASGPGSASVTLSTSAVTGKLLTGLNLTGGGTIAATDSILQAFGKVQNQISGMVGGVTYQGTWNASTNTPTLTSSVGTKGYYYIVDVAGSTNLNGITDWKIGDWAIFNGSTWDKVDNTDAVSSVNGFTGAVSLTTSNISEGTNLYYLDSRARLALSFTAGSGAYDNTTGVITIPTNTSQLTNGANFITLSSLSASSPLAYNNGTGAFSIQVANGSQNGYLSSTDWTTFNNKQNALTNPVTGTGTTNYIPKFTGTSTIGNSVIQDDGSFVSMNGLKINTSGGTAQAINFQQAGALNFVGSGYSSIGAYFSDSFIFAAYTPSTSRSFIFSTSTITSATTRTYNMPATDGTLALTSQIPTNPVGGTGTTNYLSKFTGTSTIGNSLLYDNGSAVLLGTATAGSGKFMVYSTTPDNHYQAVGSGPSFRFADTITSPTYTGIVALSTATNQFLTGSVAGDMVLANNTTSSIGNFLFGTGATERMRISPTGNVSINNTNNTYTFDVTGTVRFTGQLRLQSTITDGTNTYTLPSATGTLALTSQIPANPVGGTGTTNYIPKFTGTSTIGNSAIFENGTNVGINTASPSSYTNLTTLTINGTNGSVIDLKTGNTLYGEIYSLANELRIDAVGASSVLKFLTNSVTRATLDASGNLGLGVTPSAWATTKAIQIGASSVLWNYNNSENFYIGSNYYFDGSRKYIANGYATEYAQFSGSHIWYTAPSGTAGNAISFTQAMTLNASGNLSLGNTNNTYKLDVSGTGRFTGSVYSEDVNSYLLNQTGNTTDTKIWSIQNLPSSGQFRIRALNDAMTNGINAIVISRTGISSLSLDFTGAATFSSSVTTGGNVFIPNGNYYYAKRNTSGDNINVLGFASGSDTLTIKGGTSGSAASIQFADTGGTIATFYNSNLGIGTTSPGEKLTVNGTIGLQNSGTQNWGIYTTSTNNIVFQRSGIADRMVITSDGNVGIGTTSPNYTGYGSGITVLSLATSTSDKFSAIELVGNRGIGGNQNGSIAFINNNGTATVTSRITGINTSGSVLGGEITFETKPDAGSLTERMRITSGGLVGIGTSTPSAIGTGYGGLDLRGTPGAGFWFGRSDNTASCYLGSDSGGGFLYSYSNIPLYFGTNNTERMRITSGGNLLVGDTSNASGSPTFYVKNKNGAVANIAGWNFGGTTTAENGNNNLLSSGAYYNGSNLIATQNEATIYQQYQGNHIFYTNTGLTGGSSFSNTERMRITSGGQISQTTSIADWSHVISNASTTSPNGMIIQYTGANKNNTGNQFLYCTDNSGATLRFEVRSNGGIANYQANDVNLSDIRTKKDISPLESYWDKFKAIEMVKFKYKDQTHDDFNIGVIAQQVEKVAPEFVDVEGWGDDKNNKDPLKSIYTSDLHHATIKVLQEAMAKIEFLEKELDTLKNK